VYVIAMVRLDGAYAGETLSAMYRLRSDLEGSSRRMSGEYEGTYRHVMKQFKATTSHEKEN
jgi:hypothetical protein